MFLHPCCIFFELLTLAGTNNGIGRFKIGILQFEAFAYFFLSTNSLHLKMDGWKMKTVLLGQKGLFSGAFAVSFPRG